MTLDDLEIGAPDSDNAVDIEIRDCLNPQNPKSFFLYAGAGSGKTRSLKNALDSFRENYGDDFRRAGKKIAVITYTNAAADEIADRVGKDPLFPISTIHSFCWAHIGTYYSDIQSWLLANLPIDLADLRLKQEKGRSGSKAALDRERGIAAILKRLEWLATPRRFTYNPNGDNFGADSLAHSEVLKITANFINSKTSMRAVLSSKFPFLLIDESQDTSEVLIDALFAMAESNKGKFALGLFGDTMQRIFADGRPDLGRNIPADWAHPVKRMNHRSPRRVVRLGNSIRAAVDEQRQLARDDSAIGTVRLFIGAADATDKIEREHKARARMAELTGDSGWLAGASAVKTLTLEHHMAAARGGFLPMFEALDKDSRLSTGLRKGELAGLRLFTERIAPLLAASAAGDKFALMEILRKNSPLLERSVLTSSENADDPLWRARAAVDAITKLDTENPQASFLEQLECLNIHGLFEIPTALRPFIDTKEQGEEAGSEREFTEEETDEETEAYPSSLQAWRAFLETPYRQIDPFAEYVSDNGPYGTHQGVKGRQFDRVFVILDDSEARGFMFSYEKLLGAKPLSPEDKKRIAEGTETGIDRTRRLLYVTCTRAQKSLALVAYSEAPDALAAGVVKQGWFTKEEIESI
jgi:DNA helicase-2/ATP-dependent DNA helicase PcrA